MENLLSMNTNNIPYNVGCEIKNVKRIWFITDTHLGVKNNSKEWFDIQRNYFEEWFNPLLEQNYKPGDVLFHLGDLFDNRNSLQLPILNYGMDLVQKWASMMPIFIIAGNHDCWSKYSTEINSLRFLRTIQHVYVYENPETLLVDDKKFLMLPWRASHDDEYQELEKTKADYLFCHMDIIGMSWNKTIVITDGVSMDIMKKFKRVYCGHIHTMQKKKNVRLLGSPYGMDRNCIDTTHGIWVWDLKSDTEEFFENTYSPKFIRLYLKDILTIPYGELKDVMHNNFVDIIVDPIWFSYPEMFSSIYDLFGESARTITMKPLLESEHKEIETLDTYVNQHGSINIMNLIDQKLSTYSMSDSVKGQVFDYLKKIYEQVCNSDKSST